MASEDPILEKMRERLERFMNSPEMLKWADLLSRKGVWVDASLQPGGPGILTEPPDLSVESSFRKEVYNRVDAWTKNYDASFLKAHRLKP